MDETTIAGNNSINRKIHDCFKLIGEEDRIRFTRKFAEQPHDESQVAHTFRELLLGAYLRSCGFDVIGEHRIDSKTPDWCLPDAEGNPSAVFELVNLHAAHATERDIERQFKQRGMWSGWTDRDGLRKRLYSTLHTKFSKYRALVTGGNLAYVIGLHPHFFASVDLQDIAACLLAPEGDLFELYPCVSGVLFFAESGSSYRFNSVANPVASNPFVVPEGRL